MEKFSFSIIRCRKNHKIQGVAVATREVLSYNYSRVTIAIVIFISLLRVREGRSVRKRIRQIARGRFDYEKPLISLSEEELKLQVTEGQEYSGSFTITSSNHVQVRGLVYSTSPRMECLTPQFEGEEVRIRYQFHSKGLVEGDVETGDFVIVCEQEERSLSFDVSVSKLYAESTMGTIRSLYDFTCLAKEKWSEAYQLFYHKGFSNIINAKEQKEAMIYRGIVSAKPSQQNMEEFLVGIQKKNPVHISLEQTGCCIRELTETSQQEAVIRKNEWGYVSVRISTDADFIRLSDDAITTDDFLGSSYTYKYLVDYDQMHAGWNYGRICFRGTYETLYLEVSAHKGPVTDRSDSVRAQIKECKVGIMELYQAYRLKRIVTGVWANETVDILNHLHALDPDEPMYLLMKAQALHINRQRQEAEWILEDFRREWPDRRSPVWGYYLYIMTLMEREPSYVDRMTREIELIFHENPDSVLLFWVLSFLEEEYYNNSAHKLKAIEYWVMKGCTSPYLYLEAYYLICQDPYLLTKLGAFELRILRWAVRRRALNKDLAAQIFQIVEFGKGFDEVQFTLLLSAYEVDPKPEYVGMICSYLIKAQKFDKQYHVWFEKGIELELRITSLYEAYLLSFDERGIVPVPKIIQMYFQYDSTLPYKKMAILYNNIIASKDKCPEVYEQYRRTMGRFAMEQVEQEHMDDNLAVLYEEMLDLGFVNEEIAHCLAHIVFTNKLVVFDSRIVRAIIYQKQMKEPQIVPVVEQAAYFQLYTNEYVILFEDEKGQRYVSSISYRLQKLMEPERYLAKCMELAPQELSYIVASFEQKQSYLTFSDSDKNYFKRILFAKELNPGYQSDMALEIVRFYQTQEYDGTVVEYLKQADFTQMSQSVRRYMLETLVDNHLYDQAYELIQVYGMDQIGSAAKVTLASYKIAQTDREEENADEYLLLLAATAFRNKKYNDTMLDYLCRFYNGPTEWMCTLWRAAKQFEIGTFELEERILVQMMYAGRKLGAVEDIFESYYNAGGRELVVLAYLTACAHAYFVEDAQMGQELLDLIQARYISHQELNDACKLALLKSLAARGEDASIDLQDALLSEYTRRNMNFAFYRQLNRKLVQKYHLYDKVFLEYRTDPRNHVVLHYSRDEDGEDFVKEDMPDVYDGIFVKQFVMFFGESVQYYITEEHGNQVDVTQSSRITSSDVYTEKDESRYNLLNQMLMASTLQDDKSLYHNMKQYAGFDEVTRKVFKLL